MARLRCRSRPRPGGLVGESGSAKTFIALDCALAITLGRPWADKTVQPGAVVYVTPEGTRGFRKRIVAARQHYQPAEGLPFYLITENPQLGCEEGDAEVLSARILDQVDEPIALVIIDTLARAMAGADESSSRDMTIFVNNCERIAEELNCFVLVIHHIGKNAERGARGSSVLKAAADVELMVKGTEGERTVTITKAKDGEAGLTMAFTLEAIEIEANGLQFSSCVVRITKDWGHSSKKPARKIPEAALAAFEALQLAITEAGEKLPPSDRFPPQTRFVQVSLWKKYVDSRQICLSDKPDSKDKAFKRAALKLQALKKIGVWNGWVWICA
jgi:RecA-family ATPase